MLNQCLSCVHCEDALVQLELNSVLDVNCGVELDTKVSVGFRLKVDWELFDIIVTAPLAHSRTHAHTHGTHRETGNSPTTVPSLLVALSHVLSLIHSRIHSLTPSITYSLAHPVSQSVQTRAD